ncbi:MAG TPA: hypothetical protein VFJ97_17820 [Dermatophilaceae bacterium]|nr:hypothetical protein [Dermatophilaceae bacterium]
MQGVPDSPGLAGLGPGTVLADRYAVQRRLSSRVPAPEAARWTAVDTILERTVCVTVVDAHHPNAPAALDAARRAAGVEDVRLVRILDVGTHDGISFVVEEHHPGATPLSVLLQEGTLAAAEARRITGELAIALETARLRGLHHLCLTPRVVARTAHGSVKLTGIAVAAALTGQEDTPTAQAARADSIGLVAILYAALTGRWPGTGPPAHPQGRRVELDPGLPLAPRVSGSLVAASDITAGVPGDLDRLCRDTLSTLGQDRGPRTPAEVADLLGPWPQRPASRTASATAAGAPAAKALTAAGAGGATPTAPLAPEDDMTHSAATAEPDGPGRAAEPVATQRLPVGADEATSTAGSETAPASASPGETAEPRAGTARVGRWQALAAATVGRLRPQRNGRFTVAAAATPPAAPTAGTPDAGTTTGTPVTTTGTPAAGTTAGTPAAAPTAGTPATGTTTGTPGTTTGTPASGPASPHTGRAVATTSGPAAPTRPRTPVRAAHLPEVLTEDASLVEPPLPMLPPETGLNPPPGQSRVVLLIVLGVLLVALLLGYCGLRGLGASISLPSVTPGIATVTATAPPVTVTGGPGATTSPAVGPSLDTGPIAILSARGFDPQGDKVENNADAPKVYDGKAATVWRSEGYRSAGLGGLKKGIGVLLDLGQQARVGHITLTLGDKPVNVRVLATNKTSVEGAFLLGQADGARGVVQLTAPADAPKTQFVIVWFTQAALTDDGKYRATLAEIVLS